MSIAYAASLSPYENKGKCGQPEIFDDADDVETKLNVLAEWMRRARHCVVHTGAGASTAAGIPDFRGPHGVWTLEKEGRSRKRSDVGFGEAIPTTTHMALVRLEGEGLVKCVVTQNIDGLHLKSGFPRDKLCILHGDVFTEKCERCGREFCRNVPVESVGEKLTGNKCDEGGGGRGKCRGKLRDTLLDWEGELPLEDLNRATRNSKEADLSICLGTSLQMMPAASFPLMALKNKGRLVICNLQPTKYDKRASLVIHAKVDDIMKGIMKRLGYPIGQWTQVKRETEPSNKQPRIDSNKMKNT